MRFNVPKDFVHPLHKGRYDSVMKQFGENIIDIPDPPKEELSKKEKEKQQKFFTFGKKQKHVKVKQKNLVKFLVAELTQLDAEWWHYYQIEQLEDNSETEAQKQKDEDDWDWDYDPCLYIDGKVDFIFDVINHFGFDKKEFLKYTPKMNEYARTAYYNPAAYDEEIKKSVKA